jgi:hypothetical protein
MTGQAITLHLPDRLYQRLAEVADASQQPLGDVVLQSIRVGLPPSLERVPERFRDDLRALNRLSDEVLWQVARGDIKEDKAVLYEALLEQNSRGELDEAGRAMLTTLREEADLLMFRRSFVCALLMRWRGHRIPSLGELQGL